MQKISAFLWFDNNAEEAVKFYLSVFKKGKIRKIAYYPEGSPGPAGSVMTVEFELFGQQFTALNGGPLFKFNESVSLVVNCKTQREIDRYWEKLSSGGGEKSQCGWLKDKYGLSWQITPTGIDDLFDARKNGEGARRAMQAMLQMGKLDIAKLKAAAKKK